MSIIALAVPTLTLNYSASILLATSFATNNIPFNQIDNNLQFQALVNNITASALHIEG